MEILWDLIRGGSVFTSSAESAVGRDAGVASSTEGIRTKEVGGIGLVGRVGSAIGIDGDGISLIAGIGRDEIS